MADTPTPFSWPSAFAGFAFSAVAGLATAFVQAHFISQQQQTQLFLDEKKEFVGACDEYLKQYRTWFELTHYYAFKDSIPGSNWSNVSLEPIKPVYVKFRHDFDLSYGKIFLISDNDFGLVTMQTSTVISNALNTLVFTDTLSNKAKAQLFTEANDYFMSHWMNRAQQEIFRYNTGTRMQKSLQQSFDEIRESAQREHDDSLEVIHMYEGMQQADRYMKREDSLIGRKSRVGRTPTMQEFREFVRPGRTSR